MTANSHRTIALGELITAAFDDAARFTTDPKEMSQLATDLVAAVLRQAAMPRENAS